MIRLTITQQAYNAIVDSLPPHSRVQNPQYGPNGHMYIWMDEVFCQQLEALRREGEDISDTIIRLAEMET